jgi:hypothetical protein
MSVSGCLSITSFRLSSQDNTNLEKQAVGSSLPFDYFFLAKQEKVTRQSRKGDPYQIDINYTQFNQASFSTNQHVTYPIASTLQ